ncbi:MAG: methionyl-tRNA formyltransferase [Candidatus Limnocylindrales bacterium]
MSAEPIAFAESGVATLFIGSGRFGLPTLELLRQLPAIRLVGVVTAPPRPAGRGERMRRSPVAERAAALGIGPVLEPERVRDPSSLAEIVALKPALVVLADYGQMLPAALLELPIHGALNLHPSLLPRHRGASPIPAAILAGDRETGVTLMVMEAGLDSGPIVAQLALPLDGTETAPQLETRLALAGASLLREVLPGWLAGAHRPRPQPQTGITLTRALRREDGRLDPARAAVSLERQVRAYQPWPGTWAETPAGRLIVWSARPLTLGAAVIAGHSPAGAPAGRAALGERVGGGSDAGETLGLVVPDDDGLAVLVADGALRLDEVQLGGGRRMPASDLRRGHPELVGSRLGRPTIQ